MGKKKRKSPSRKKTKKIKRPRNHPQKKQETIYVLDQFSVRDIRAFDRIRFEVLSYHYKYYAELANQRTAVYSDLKNTLSKYSANQFKINRWGRRVGSKWGLQPLNTRGSLRDPGGRFNIGNINQAIYPIFPALYLAEDHETAMAEALGNRTGHQLSRHESALAPPESSYSYYVVNGVIDNLLDLRDESNLRDFVDEIKNFKIPQWLDREARRLNFQNPNVVTSTAQLLNTLLDPDWRVMPMNFDVPSNSQIFGRIAKDAGIEAILYPSKFTDKCCLTVFIENFKSSSSYIELADEAPADDMITKLDSDTWKDLI